MVAICHWQRSHRWQIWVSTTLAKLGEKFAVGVVDTGGKFAGGAP